MFKPIIDLWNRLNEMPYFQPAVTMILIIITIIVMKIIVTISDKVYKKKVSQLNDSDKQPFKSLKIGDYELVSLRFQQNLLTFFYGAVKYLVIGFFFFTLLPLIFLINPASKEFLFKTLEIIQKPVVGVCLAITNYIPSLITILLIIFIVRYLLKGVNFFTEEIRMERLKIKGFYPEWAKPTGATFKIILYIMAIVVIAPYLPGSGSDAFKGISVMAGIVISMGSTSSVGNAIAGLILTYMRAFKVGDRVKLDTAEGIVMEKSLLVTRIKTPKNERITIPNASILSNPIINYTFSAKNYNLIIHTSVTIGYDVDWRIVHELLIGATSDVKNILESPEPFVLQISLNDFYVEYQLNVHVKSTNKLPLLRSHIHQNIQDSFRENGIEILSPHYRMNRRESTGERIEDIG